MSAHDVKLFGDQIAASRLESRFASVKATSLIRLAIEDLFPGRIALVSSFGADAAALLHMVSRVDKATPVIFVDTGQHFPRRSPIATNSCALLGLTNVINAEPNAETLAEEDPEKWLFSERPRPMLRDPQGPAARRRHGRLRRLDHRPQGLSERDARDAAAVRGRGRPGEGQSAGRLERRGRARPTSARPDCRAIRWSPRAFPRSAACLARARSGPARTSAPAAGADAARPNAASTPRFSTRERTSDGPLAPGGFAEDTFRTLPTTRRRPPTDRSIVSLKRWLAEARGA